MKNFLFLTLLSFIISSQRLYAQVAVGTETPHPSAALEVFSANKGVIFPRVSLSSNVDIGTVPNPAKGLVVYNTGEGDLKYAGYVFWNGDKWEAFNGTSTEGEAAKLQTKAVTGSLKATTDNGRAGYAISITTPDGKFSVRAFVPTSSSYSQINLQIRNNDVSNVSIISNGHYFWSGAGGYQQNNLRLPPGAWAGDNATSSANLIDGTTGARIQTASTNPYWGDPETYAGGMPEQRSYSWTLRGAESKVFYRLTYMFGAENPATPANASNCPNGECPDTKAYFLIEQISE